MAFNEQFTNVNYNINNIYFAKRTNINFIIHTHGNVKENRNMCEGRGHRRTPKNIRYQVNYRQNEQTHRQYNQKKIFLSSKEIFLTTTQAQLAISNSTNKSLLDLMI